MGTGHDGTADGTEVNCTFTQVKGIRSLYNTISARTVKLVSGLSGTVSFLRTLRSLYNSFGIGAQTVNAVQLSLQDAVNNVNEYVTLHGKTGKKVMTRARYFNTLNKRKFF